MKAKKAGGKKKAHSQAISVSRHFNWPDGRRKKDDWWKGLAEFAKTYPFGKQTFWGLNFKLGEEKGPNVILVSKAHPAVTVSVNKKATHMCFAHTWRQLPNEIRQDFPREGLVVGEYTLCYADGSRHCRSIRARFEVPMQESVGPCWQAMPWLMYQAIDPAFPPPGMRGGRAQFGIDLPAGAVNLWIYALENPHPKKVIKSVILAGHRASPLLIAGMAAFTGSSHPLKHLPRRTYRVISGGKEIETAEVDLGIVNRKEQTRGPRGKTWLKSVYSNLKTPEPPRDPEELLEITAAEDATLSVKMKGERTIRHLSIGKAFEKGQSADGRARLQVLGKKRQWMQVKVIDKTTGKPTPVRLHISGSRGEYIAPYGHHSRINHNWFEDYGADVISGGKNYAYVDGHFSTDLPTGDLFVEINKGYEYAPVRKKVRVRPGQKDLVLSIDRWKDLRSKGWVTADTHVHFISPHTAWLEGQCEGVNVINLLASQWGRLFTNVGDLTGRVGIVENDTIVYVGTENRNHMLGHMSMLGTKGLPVYPMCAGGPTEAWMGDPDFVTLAEWAAENRRKGGLVIRPHFPMCGNTEDPVPILKGLVDALEVNVSNSYGVQEWYRYLNNGYRVAVAGGTDKMSACTAVGWLRTYAKLDPNRGFTYESWMKAVRAGRTCSTTGPIIDLLVEGKGIGDTLRIPASGAVVEVDTTAECFAPIGSLQIVRNGQVVAEATAPKGSRKIRLREKIRMQGQSGWIAARCKGIPRHPGDYLSAHTSPVYLKSGNSRAFDGPAMEHLLSHVEGGIEYLNKLATMFDEASRKRMVKLFKEAQKELKGRLVVEGGHHHHHGAGGYHVHGYGGEADHQH